MKKIVLMILALVVLLKAHPVSYTINLEVTYDKINKEANIICSSNSKNKCGLHNFHLVDENEKIITTKKFPFLRKSTNIKLKNKPQKMIFFLRKVPDHKYTVLF